MCYNRPCINPVETVGMKKPMAEGTLENPDLSGAEGARGNPNLSGKRIEFDNFNIV